MSIYRHSRHLTFKQFILILGSCVSLHFTSCLIDSEQHREELKFTRLSSEETGIDFINEIKANLSTKENLFDFDYFYNGGGVCVVDINNDHLLDMILTGNQVPNKLFLNKGAMQFEDITEGSGINVDKNWSNGITTCDVNKDGFMDLYISQGGPYKEHQRNNLLFINNGDLTFSNKAEEYGLNDLGISTQSAFFDYDKDGDMDCIVMNESLLYGYDPISFQRLITENPDFAYTSYSHFYINENGKFIDKTSQVGIDKPTFGLGLAISDLNADGWPDIYIANDYYLPDNLYINRGDGTFRDRISNYIDQTAFFGMGVDVGDINNDGFLDIYVLDMASSDHYRSKTLMASMDVPAFNLLTEDFGYIHQYMFNALNVNDQMGRYKNVAQMSGVAKTDWSWAALIEDVDLDGDKDIFVSNGYRKYALDNDFRKRVNSVKRKYKGNVPLESKELLYAQMPTEPLPNILFENTGDFNFKNIANQIGLDMPTYSNGAVLADLDNDGDMDLVVNNIDQPVLVYKNNASEIHNYIKLRFDDNQLSHLARIECHMNGEVQLFEKRNVRGYNSAKSEDLIIGLGDLLKADKILIYWLDGLVSEFVDIKANTILNVSHRVDNIDLTNLKKTNSKKILPFAPVAIGLDFVHIENEYNDFQNEILLPQKQSTLGPCIVKADIDGDGDEDLFIGGAKDQSSELYLNMGTTMKRLSVGAFIADRGYEDVAATFFDLEDDGDLDLYVVSGGNEKSINDPYYQDRVYRNDGDSLFVKLDFPDLRNTRTSGGVVRSVDFDLDGDMDLLIGQRIVPQNYPKAAKSLLFENHHGQLIMNTKNNLSQLISDEIVNDIEVIDIDLDGDQDIIAVGEWGGIRVIVNQDGVYQRSPLYSNLDSLTGWWFSITPIEVNGDGIPDLVIGNVGSNIKHNASIHHPFRVYADDFDHTGTLDIVLATDYKGDVVPVRGKECSSQQMPFVAEKYKSYDQYARGALEDIYGSEMLKNAYYKEVVEFRSVLLLSEKSGFQVTFLPSEAQAFPLLDAIALDINKDGHPDLITAGNIYNTEVETPRMDAGNGKVLISNGVSGFESADCPKYCLSISGNVKDIESINIEEDIYILGGVNDGPLAAFKLKLD